MMTPMEWLKATHGLDALQPDEIDAIRDFTLLWGLFEDKAMATEGNQPQLVAAVDRMALPDPLPASMVAALAYWRGRFWEAGAATPQFSGLRFRVNPHRALVMEVLAGDKESGSDVVKTLLLITQRLRNNLFHGVKWQYQLYDQLGNFSHANQVLMPAIDLAVQQSP